MRIDDIKLLFAYNEWANERILDAAEKAAPEQLTMSNNLGWGNLQGALLHILDAEYGWRHHLTEKKEVAWLEASDFADVAAIRARWAEENAALWRYLHSLSEADVNGLFTYEVKGETRQRTLWHFLVHVVNHGTQHRSECAALLTGFGHSPGDMDFLLFVRQHAAGSA